MQDVAAKSANKSAKPSATKSAKTASSQRKPRKCDDAHTALDLRYGQIGISAVADRKGIAAQTNASAKMLTTV